MKINVTNTDQYSDIDAGETRQRVSWEISEGDEVLFEGNQSFPLTVTADEVKDFLSQCLSTHKADIARYEESKVLQEQLDNATSVADEINGLEIND